MEKENIYTHVEDTMSNIYCNGIMLNSGTVMLILEEKDQCIKELEKELKKVKQQKRKLFIKNGRYKRRIEKLLQHWLDTLCNNETFISEEKLKQELQKYDKDKLIELYFQMCFERDVWRDLEEENE